MESEPGPADRSEAVRTGRAPITTRVAWRRGDAQLEQDAVDFWRRHQLLPEGVSPEARAADLCIAAYQGEELVAVSTVALQYIPSLRARLAMARVAAAPEQHRGMVRTAAYTIAASIGAVRDWAREHPQERVMGLATITSALRYETKRQAVWRCRGEAIALIGFTPEGYPIRATWFPGARTDPPPRRPAPGPRR
jgi:hypothetical protein